MPKNQVKLILNLVLMAVAAVPRGGSIKVTISGEPTKPEVTFLCSGPSARIPAAFEKLIPGTIVDVNIDAHAVQPYYAGLLARTAGMTVAAVLDGADVVITARPVSAKAVEEAVAETAEPGADTGAVASTEA
jgi:histidine phosphotransferase ChpT